MSNLADRPEQAAILQSLKTQLAEWCKTQGDVAPLAHLTQRVARDAVNTAPKPRN